MTTFWVVAGIFIVGALLFILPTLWSKRERKSGVARDATNVDVAITGAVYRAATSVTVPTSPTAATHARIAFHIDTA